MQMQSIAIAGIPARRFRGRVPAILRGRRPWLLLGAAAMAAGLAWQWSWLMAIGVAPVLLSVAPCAAMCGLGLCMARMGGGSCQSSSTGGGACATRTSLAAGNGTSETTIRN